MFSRKTTSAGVAPTVGFGAIGFADDYLKFIKRQSKGLSAAQKFTCQILVALTIGVFLYTLPSYTTKLSVPFFKFFTPDLGSTLCSSFLSLSAAPTPSI